MTTKFDKNTIGDEVLVHNDGKHGAPKTRRQFLSRGLLAGAGSIVMPGVLDIINPARAYGKEVQCAAGEGGLPPMLVFDLAGGGNIPYGNVLVGGAGGQEDFLNDPGAALLGTPSELNPKNNPNVVDSELGLRFHSNSAMLAGIRAVTTAETRAKTEGLIIAGRSTDDSRTNPLNPLFWTMKAGLKGTLIDLVGNSNNGGLGKSVAPNASLKPSSFALIQSGAAAAGLVDAGLLATLLPGKAESILKAARRLSSSQLAAFSNKALPAQIKELVECGYMQSVENLSKYTPESLNPANDPVVQAVNAINNIGVDPTVPAAYNLNNDQADAITAIGKLLLEGNAGGATVELGGYDYHNNARAATDQRDFNVGVNIGRALSLAAGYEKPLVISVITDGGVSSRGGNPEQTPSGVAKFQFSSDSGTRSSAFMLAFHPAGRPEVMRDRQLGAFVKDSGAVDVAASPVANSAVNVTKAMFLNYLSFADKVGDFEKTVDSNPFGADPAGHIVLGPPKKS